MGFYIRKGFNFGPLRLNLSRSGLGASVGIKGARIGMGPKGTYVHVGRGGFYYRQTITPRGQFHESQSPASAIGAEEFQEISSSAAQTIVDSSADQLLQELNRVKRRLDLFPVTVVVGSILLIRIALALSGVGLPLPGDEWRLWFFGLIAMVAIAIFARHSDVTNGTLILEYSLDGDMSQDFSRLQSVFQRLGTCQRLWHVDAGAYTSDWKRNAGVNHLTRRSVTSVMFTCPPKVRSNFKVPTIKAGRRTLYFFPERLLIYDSSGVGAVPYSDLLVQEGVTRFVEDGYAPGDGTQVGTTWRYVNKNGGPDRRFNNNRLLPIMQYGQLGLASQSGVRELFECSIPVRASEVSSSLAELKSGAQSSRIDVSFAASERDNALIRVGLWSAVVLIGLMALVSLYLDNSHASDERLAQIRLQQQREDQSRQQFAQALNQSLRNRHLNNVAATVVDDNLALRFTKESSKTARRDGVKPLEKNTLFARVMPPNTEAGLCSAGFRALQVTANDDPPNYSALACPSKGAQ